MKCRIVEGMRNKKKHNIKADGIEYIDRDDIEGIESGEDLYTFMEARDKYGSQNGMLKDNYVIVLDCNDGSIGKIIFNFDI